MDEARGVEATSAPDGWLHLIITARDDIAVDILGLDFCAPDGAVLPSFDPGAHIDVETPGGAVRQYSLCDGDSRRYRIAVLRDSASTGGSVALHDQVKVGDRIRVGVPRNHFPLKPCAGRALLLAGGIGITPLLPMARHLARVGADFALHYAARAEGQMAFRDILQQPPLANHTTLYVSEAGTRMDLGMVLSRPGPDDHVYICGPVRFIEAALAAASVAGWTPTQIHREFFAAAALPVQNGDTFHIRLARSGGTYLVPPDISIAEVLTQNGVNVDVRCSQGICGACLTGLVAGEADHRDMFQTEAEQARHDNITLCCSRAKSPLLVLDL